MTGLYRRSLLGAALVSLLPVSPRAAEPTTACALPAAPPPARPQRAFSLRALEAELGACARAGKCGTGVTSCYGITRLDGYVIDRAKRDIVPFGIVEADAPALRVEEFVVALRNVDGQYLEPTKRGPAYSPPTVSIDPRSAVLRQLNLIGERAGRASTVAARDEALAGWGDACRTEQDVVILGMPKDSHFAFVAVKADYDMKRITDGSDQLDLEGFTSLMDTRWSAMVEAAKTDRPLPPIPTGINRFWLTPGVFSYLEDSESVMLDRTEVVLQNEHLAVGKRGERAASGRVDPEALAYVCRFSQRLAEVAARRPIYRELANLYRYMALARILADRKVWDELGYRPEVLLDRLVLPKYAVRQTLPGLGRVEIADWKTDDGRVERQVSLRGPVCGGVSMDFGDGHLVATPDRMGQAATTGNLVLASRPDPNAVAWPVGVG